MNLLQILFRLSFRFDSDIPTFRRFGRNTYYLFRSYTRAYCAARVTSHHAILTQFCATTIMWWLGRNSTLSECWSCWYARRQMTFHNVPMGPSSEGIRLGRGRRQAREREPKKQIFDMRRCILPDCALAVAQVKFKISHETCVRATNQLQRVN